MIALIIDDEINARIVMETLLAENFPEISFLESQSNLMDGVKSIKKNQPDIVFLDIEMPEHNGLEILDFFEEKEVNFKIIFTTAYSEYAVNAFELSAIDYLLKPIQLDYLRRAISRVSKSIEEYQLSQKVNAFKSNLITDSKKVAIAVGNEYIFIEAERIMYVEAAGSYSLIHLINKETITVSKNLREFETLLNDKRFFRIHRGYLINLYFIKKLNKSEGFNIQMMDQVNLPLSREKKEQFLELIKDNKALF